MRNSQCQSLVVALVVLLAAAAVYLPGLHNALVFDDARLTDGTIFGSYGGLLDLRPRLISYGSFVWVDDWLGGGWPAQRIVNLLLHLGSAAGLWLLVRGLIESVSWTAEAASRESQRAAAMAGAALFALNPVAVYAVAYLVQRSTLMASFFSVWCLVCVLHAGRHRRHRFLAGALGLYLLAILSKEHAVLLPIPAIALYLMLRPLARRQAWAFGGALLLIASACSILLLSHYGHVAGQVFDQRSEEFVGYLESIKPGIRGHAWMLSAINQSWLFFRYGLLWAVPNVDWMSVDLRPAFPLSASEFPQVMGPPLFLLLTGGSIYLMARFADWRRYLGFSLFLPASLFATEFGTVWVQDPFVLYRSYLWAMGMPLLFAFPFVGARPKTIALVSGVIALAFCGLSFERVQSFRDDAALWADAADKHVLNDRRGEVGKGRAFMWRGNDFFVKGMFALALEDYQRALQAGEAPRRVHVHRAAALNMLGQAEAALSALDIAQGASGRLEKPSTIPLLRAQILARLRRYGEAGEFASQALEAKLDDDERALMLSLRAQARMQRAEFVGAVEDYRAVLELEKDNRPARIGYALALRSNGRLDEAIDELRGVLGRGDGADVRFGLALVFEAMGRRAEALSEARRALELKPGDAALRALAARLGGE